MCGKRSVPTHVDDGPLLHDDGVVCRGDGVRLAVAPLLEDEDTFHRLRHRIYRERGDKSSREHLVDRRRLSRLSCSFRPKKMERYQSVTFTLIPLFHSRGCVRHLYEHRARLHGTGRRCDSPSGLVIMMQVDSGSGDVPVKSLWMGASGWVSKPRET